MKIILEKNSEILFTEIVTTLMQELEHRVPTGPVVFGLCGGRSVIGILKSLRRWIDEDGEIGKRKQLFERLHFFMVDERLVPFTSEHSNFGMIKSQLFDELLAEAVVKEDQLHPFVTDEKANDFGASAYLKEFSSFGGKFHAVILGVGEDGHVAGLFPHHAVLQRPEKLFLSYVGSPKPPQERMTATLPLLQVSTCAVLLFTGEAKRNAWERFSREDTAVADCPSVGIKGCEWVVVGSDLLS